MKRNLKQYMGVCLLLILSVVSGHTALAANTWKMAAKELTKKAQTNLSLRLENSDAVNAFQFDLTLPAGLKLTGTPILNENRISDHNLDWTALSENQYRCIVYSLSNANLEGNSGELLSIPVLVDLSFTGGQVTLTNLVLTNQKAAELSVSTDMGLLSEKKEYIQLLVSGLTQKVSDKDAVITVTTIPADLNPGVSITYPEGGRTTEGAYTVKVTRAEDEIYYKVDTTFRMVLVAKDQPQVTVVPKASQLNEGQRLAQSILSGGSATKGDANSPVPGKFVWLNPEQIVTAPAANESTVTYTALFIPTDESRYANVEVSVPVTVNPVYHVYFLPQAGGSLKIEGEHADQMYVSGQKLIVTAVPDPNYEFVKWIGLDSKNAEQEITVSSNMTISPIFERPKYEVNVQNDWNGTLTVTCDGVALNSGKNYCAKGSTLLVQYIPNENYVLKSLTIGGKERTKYVVENNVSIEVETVWQEAPLTIKTVVSGEGSIRLFNEEGKAILPGSALTEGRQFTVISVPEPGCELEALEVKGATLSNGKYTLTGETTVTAKFKRSSYQLIENYSGNGTLTITPQKELYEYGDQVTITASGDNLYRLVVNGKAIENGQLYTITGNTNVYAKFLVREKLNPDFIKQDAQSYVFNNQYQRFQLYLSNIYAYWDFNVSYPGIEAGEAPVNFGDYDVRITREADQNYEAFDLTLQKALKVTKAKMRVTEAPTSAGTTGTDNLGKTSPQYGDVQIEPDANKSYLYKFTYYPNDNDKANYEPVVYYHSTSSNKFALSVGSTTTLKSTEVPGYVLVTNGNMVVEDLNAIPQGTMLTLQAIANPNYRFKGWKIGGASEILETDKPIEIPLESNLTYEPVFEGKAVLSASIQTTPVPSGTLPAITVTAPEGLTAPTDFQVRFFADANGTQPIAPQDVQNVGTYYVQAYRAEDEQFKELNSDIFTFTVQSAEIPSDWITWPTATEILPDETLAASQLIGGSAGELEGTFAWKDSDTKPTATGEQDVTFTPVDPNYKPATGKATVEVLSTTSSTGEIKEPEKPSDPIIPDTPEEPEKPTVTPPVVAERTPTTAVITWDKVEGATSYTLFLYAKKGDTTPLMTYEFDSNGQLKASAISFNLTGLEEGKSYYVKTVAYKGEEVLVEQAIVLSATPTAIEQIADAIQITTTKGMIHVNLATSLSVRVISMTGLTLYEQADALGRLDIPATSAGVYAVILYKGHEVLLQKVIVR